MLSWVEEVEVKMGRDIVERLRDRANGVTWHWANSEEMANEAADEIERLRAALKAICDTYMSTCETEHEAGLMYVLAREALGDE